MLVRSFLTIEGVMEQLCPELNLFDIISDKLMERMKKSFNLEQEVLSLGKGILDVGQKVSKIPQLCADTLSDIYRGASVCGDRSARRNFAFDLCFEADLPQEKEITYRAGLLPYLRKQSGPYLRAQEPISLWVFRL